VYSREYLFNPFLLQTASDDELSKEINKLAQQYRQTDMVYDIVFNINLESDLLMIYGEFIARLQEEADLLRIQADNQRDKNVYKLRKDWGETSKEKAPAMSYFEAQAEDSVHDVRVRQKRAEAMLTRFKRAYSSLESKQNALKKKLDAIKYEG
jgi:hypothetical protein